MEGRQTAVSVQRNSTTRPPMPLTRCNAEPITTRTTTGIPTTCASPTTRRIAPLATCSVCDAAGSDYHPRPPPLLAPMKTKITLPHRRFVRAAGLLLPGVALALCCGTVALAQIAPGPLSRAHQQLEGVTKCASCHEFGATTRGFKCLECHAEIRRRVDARTGFHGRNFRSAEGESDCRRCHKEHKGQATPLISLDRQLWPASMRGNRARNVTSQREFPLPSAPRSSSKIRTGLSSAFAATALLVTRINIKANWAPIASAVTPRMASSRPPASIIPPPTSRSPDCTRRNPARNAMDPSPVRRMPNSKD